MEGSHNPVELRRLIPDSVGIAMRAADPTDFLHWMRESLLTYATPGSPIRRNPNLARAVAFALTRAVWNALPVSSRGVKPPTLREPAPDDACPCGSGVALKSCCRDLPEGPLLTPETLWPYVLACVAENDRETLLRNSGVTHRVLIEFAAHLLESNRHAEVITALEPRLRAPELNNDEDTAILLDLLCEAYGTSASGIQRSLELLEWLTESAPRSPVRAEAWQRLTSIYMDRGDATRAASAFKHAQKDNPRGEALCVLEVELLVAQRQPDMARKRAAFWLKELEAGGATEDDPRLGFLRRVTRESGEPAAMLQEEAQPLRRWLVAVKTREPPLYELALMDNVAWLVAPSSLLRLEQQWHDVFPLPKPTSLHDQLFQDSDVWADDVQTCWCQFLQGHPESFDSIDILDDLATAVGRHPGARRLENPLLAPLLRRNEAILERACARLGEAPLPWSRVENRAALRGLVRLLQHHLGRSDRTAAEALADKLLRLNPADHHGVRGMMAHAGN
jgi:tetratricopeptide (TPR) repeat protein